MASLNKLELETLIELLELLRNDDQIPQQFKSRVRRDVKRALLVANHRRMDIECG